MSRNNTSCKNGIKRALPVLGVSIFWLVAIDLALRVVLMTTLPGVGKIRAFLAYGHSSETKLREAVAQNIPGDVVQAGWIEDLTSRPSNNETIGVYGMSFSDNVAHSMMRLAPDLGIRTVPGPGSPLSHTFRVFETDTAQKNLKVVIVGFNSLVQVLGMTPDSVGLDHSMGHTYPRYKVVEGELIAELPIIDSFAKFKTALSDDSLWEAHISQLAEHDHYFEPIYYQRTAIESSPLARLLIRDFRSQRESSIYAEMKNHRGFRTDTEAGREGIAVASALLQRFAELARRRGQYPLVLLFHRQGYGDFLYQTFHRGLEQKNIPYISTHTICPATDRACFGPDNYHFTKEIDDKIARIVLDQLPKN